MASRSWLQISKNLILSGKKINMSFFRRGKFLKFIWEHIVTPIPNVFYTKIMPRCSQPTIWAILLVFAKHSKPASFPARDPVWLIKLNHLSWWKFPGRALFLFLASNFISVNISLETHGTWLIFLVTYCKMVTLIPNKLCKKNIFLNPWSLVLWYFTTVQGVLHGRTVGQCLIF